MKKISLIFSLIIVLVGFNCGEVSADSRVQFDGYSLDKEGSEGVNNSSRLTVKNGSYNESEDPLFRRGTQNTDSPQSMFFIIPVALTLVFLVVLLFRKK